MNQQARIGGLGEIALCVADLETMAAFYENVVGLPVLRRFPQVVFFKIAEGFGGHTQVLALFDRGSSPTSARSTLDHFALTIDAADYAHEKARLEANGLRVETQTFPWVQWRSLFFDDPEGNRVEFVCFDPTVLKGT